MFDINRSANTNLFRSFDMLIARISLLSSSIATHHSHINSDPTFMTVSSFCIQEYSKTFLFFDDMI